MNVRAPRLRHEKTGLGWGSDPEFPVTDWQYEVSNDDTRQGYWEWVEQRKEEAREEAAWRPSGGFGVCGCCGSVADVDQNDCCEQCDAGAEA